MATQNFTYDNRAVRESLLDVITNIDPTEDQLYVGLQKSKADQPYHQWVKDTLKAVAGNARVEGADATFPDRTNPTRGANFTQIVGVDVIVTDTDRETNSAGFKDRFSYEVQKAMKEWRRDAEYAILRGSLASGSGSAARRMNGVKAQITTLTTSQSGVSLSEAIFNSYLQNAWAQGGKVDEIYVGGTLKRRISGFQTNTRDIAAADKRLVNAVDYYTSDFGPVKIFLHRFMDADNDLHNSIVGLESSKWAVAHLSGREPKMVELAKTGDSTKAMLIGELTLEARAENSSFQAIRHL